MKHRGVTRSWIRLALAFLGATAAQAQTASAQLDLTRSHVVIDNTGTPGVLCEGDTVETTIRVRNTAATPATFRLHSLVHADWWSSWSIVRTSGTDCSQNVGTLTPPDDGVFCADGVSLGGGQTLDFVFRAVVRDATFDRIRCSDSVAQTPAGERTRSNRDCVNYDCPAVTPDVSAVKTFNGPGAPAIGDTVSWTVELTNQGLQPDTNVNVQDVLDANQLANASFIGFTRPPDTLGPGPNLDATWNTFAAGEVISFEVRATYAACVPTLAVCNQARITSTAIQAVEPDGERLSHVPGGAEAATCFLAGGGSGSVINDPPVKVVNDLNGAPAMPGDVLEYTVTFETSGFCATASATFLDGLPGGTTLDLPSVVLSPAGAGTNASSPNEVRIDNLIVPPATPTGPGRVTVTFRATINAGISGPVCNGGTYEVAGGGRQLRTTSACVTVPSPNDAVSATKSHNNPNGDGTLRRGQEIRYTIRITNTSSSALSDLVLNDPIPNGVNFVRADNPAGGTVTVGPNNVNITGISVGPNGTVDVVLTFIENGALPDRGQICNLALVATSANPSGPYQTVPACVLASDLVGTSLLLSKSHDDPNGNGRLQRGQQLRYTVLLENTGASPTTGVQIDDVIPAGVTFVRVDNNGGGTVVSTSPTLTVQGLTVAPGIGNGTRVEFTVQEDGSRPQDTQICNVATARAGIFSTATNPTCVLIEGSSVPCPTPPARIVPLHCAKSLPQGAVCSWPQEANSAGGYRLYSVPQADQLPPNALNPNATVQCSTAAASATTCTDADAITTPTRLFYQVLGLCADGTEGTN